VIEFLKRVRLAVAIVVGFVAGRLAADYVGHHRSEIFSGVFLLGVILIQGVFKLLWPGDHQASDSR
jgi:hypothetical protein